MNTLLKVEINLYNTARFFYRWPESWRIVACYVIKLLSSVNTLYLNIKFLSRVDILSPLCRQKGYCVCCDDCIRAVGVVAAVRARQFGVWIPIGKLTFILYKWRTDLLEDPPRLLLNGHRASFLEAEQPRPEINYSLLSSVEIKNEWSYSSSPPLRLHVVDRENCTFYCTKDINTLLGVYIVVLMWKQCFQFTRPKFVQFVDHNGRYELLDSVSGVLWWQNSRRPGPSVRNRGDCRCKNYLYSELSRRVGSRRVVSRRVASRRVAWICRVLWAVSLCQQRTIDCYHCLLFI